MPADDDMSDPNKRKRPEAGGTPGAGTGVAASVDPAEAMMQRMAELAADKSSAKTLAGVMPKIDNIEKLVTAQGQDLAELHNAQKQMRIELDRMKSAPSMTTRAPSSGASDIGAGAWANYNSRIPTDGNNFMPEKLEIRGFAQYKTLGTNGIPWAMLLKWIEDLTAKAPQEITKRFDLVKSVDPQFQGDWPLYLMIRLKLTTPLASHVAHELAREVGEWLALNAQSGDDMKLRGQLLFAKPEIAPERRPIRKALGKAMEAFEMRGIQTKRQMKATFPSGQYLLELWSMAHPQPTVVARLHPTGWQLMLEDCEKLIGSKIDPNEFINTMG